MKFNSKVASATYQRTNFGAVSGSAPAHSRFICSGRTELQESHHSQLLSTADALNCRCQLQDKQARTAAAKQPGWPSSPHVPTSTERVKCPSLLSHRRGPALLPRAPTAGPSVAMASPSAAPALQQNGPCSSSCCTKPVLWSVSCGHASLYRLQ